jgi:hypothetical protein
MMLTSYLRYYRFTTNEGWAIDPPPILTLVTPQFFVFGFLELVLIWAMFGFIRLVYPRSLELLALDRLVDRRLQPQPPPSLERAEALLVQRRALKPDEILFSNRSDVIREIDERVDSLRERANLILAIIGGSLLAAAIIVIFAGRLTSIDASAVSMTDKLGSELAVEKKDLAVLYRIQSNYDRLDELNRKLSLTPEEDKERKALVGDLPSGSRFIGNEALPSSSSSAATMIAKQEGQIEKTTQLFDDAWKKEVNADHGYSDWRYVVATAITRIGVVLIIVFLVQILMGLYRYNTRLITYYNSRRDLLVLWEGKAEGLKTLDNFLASPKIDFGKEPKHPLEDIIRAAGGVFQKSAQAKNAAETPVSS